VQAGRRSALNELSQRLFETAWQDLRANRRTLEEFKSEVYTDWIIWRNYQVETWGEEILEWVQTRPASDFYPETPRGDLFLDWVFKNNFYQWEIPIYDGEDDDFVHWFIAHCLAVMAWFAFTPEGADGLPGCWDDLDYTEEEIDDYFRFKMNYSPRPGKRKLTATAGEQLSMF
jgi:hypothetical protein